MQSELKNPSIPRRPQKNQTKNMDTRETEEGGLNPIVSTTAEDMNVSRSAKGTKQSENIEKEIPSVPRRPQRSEAHELARYNYSNDLEFETNENMKSAEALDAFQDHIYGGSGLKKKKESNLDAIAQEEGDDQDPFVGIPSVPRRPQRSRSYDLINSDDKYSVNNSMPSGFESNEGVKSLDSQEELQDHSNYSTCENKDKGNEFSRKSTWEKGVLYLPEMAHSSKQENTDNCLHTKEPIRSSADIEGCSPELFEPKDNSNGKAEIEDRKFIESKVSEKKKTQNTSKESTDDRKCLKGNQSARDISSATSKYVNEMQQESSHAPISYDGNPSITKSQANEREPEFSSAPNNTNNTGIHAANATTELSQSPANEITTHKEMPIVPNRPKNSEASPTKVNDLEQKSSETINPPKKLSSKIAAFQQIIQGGNQQNANDNETFQKPSNNVGHQQYRPKLSSDKMQFAQNLQGMMSRGIAMPGMTDSRVTENYEQPSNEKKRGEEKEAHASAQKTRVKGPKGKRLPKSVLNAPKVDIEPRFKSTISPLWEIQFNHQKKNFTMEMNSSLVISHKSGRSSDTAASITMHPKRTLSIISPVFKDSSSNEGESETSIMQSFIERSPQVDSTPRNQGNPIETEGVEMIPNTKVDSELA